MSEYASAVGAVAENLQAAIGHLPIESLLAAQAHIDQAAKLLRESGVGRDPVAYKEHGMLPLINDASRDVFMLTHALENTRIELASYQFTLSGSKGGLPPAMVMPYKKTAPAEEPGELAGRQRRALAMRDMIDPERTLPTVTLNSALTDVSELSERRDWYILHNGEIVGCCGITQNHESKTYHFRNITLYKKLGQGIGMATYLSVISDALRAGYTFENDPYSQTESAKKIWERLAALGAAREVTPFYEAQYGKYKGYYVVDGEVHTNGQKNTGRQAA